MIIEPSRPAAGQRLPTTFNGLKLLEMSCYKKRLLQSLLFTFLQLNIMIIFDKVRMNINKSNFIIEKY